jgi:MSHA biogenesis protein MshQ
VTTYAASGTKNVTVKLVDNSDGACVLDSSATNYCSATCRGKTAVASQTLAFAPADQGQKQSAAFTINTAYRNLVAIVTDGTTSACSVDAFAVRPTAIASVTSSNATNATTSGMPIFRAGADPFALKLTTTGVAGVASGYTGVAKIDNTAVSPVAPATVAGRIAGTFPAATSGSGSSTATGAAFTYSEVGGFVLAGYSPASDTTSARGVYDGVQTVRECSGLTVAACDGLKAAAWSGVDAISTASDCVIDSYSNTKDANGKYGCNFGLQTTTATIGRFVPYEFRVASPVLTNRQAAACSPASVFSYLDEGMRLQFSLEAREGGGGVTRNYAGTLAKLPLSNDGAALNFAAVVPLPFTALSANRITGSGFATAWPAMGSANAGTLSLDGTVTVSSLTSATNNRVGPDGPFSGLVLGIAPKDSDGVQILSYDLDADNSGGTGGADHKSMGTTTLYFGQLRLLPAIGSELLPLAMRAEVQRWNGTAFVPNGDDNCTRLPEAQETLSNWRGNLTSGATNITSGALAISGGVGTIKLAAPGAGKNGSVLLTADVGVAGMPYLGGHWGGAAKYDQAPSATAAFGLYKGSGPVIYWRENY